MEWFPVVVAASGLSLRLELRDTAAEFSQSQNCLLGDFGVLCLFFLDNQ